MNTKKNCLTTAVLVTVGIVTFNPLSAQARPHSGTVYTVQDEASGLLKTVEERAYDLQNHADVMQAASTMLDRDFFISQTNTIKEDVNAMGKTLARLQALEPVETSPDRDIVEHAKSQLAQIATTTDAAIRYLNDNPGRVQFPAYRNMTTSLQRETAALWEMVHDSIRLDNMTIREQKLKQEIASIKAPGAR
jgi:hypothetical protein